MWVCFPNQIYHGCFHFYMGFECAFSPNRLLGYRVFGYIYSQPKETYMYIYI